MKAEDTVELQIRVLGVERRLPNAHLERWLAMDQESRVAILGLARCLRLRTGQLAAALETLEEIAVRERVAIAEVLARPEIQCVARGSGSAPARASAFIAALRAIRFPRLHKTRSRLAAEVAALKLPRGISIVLPRELGSDELTVSLCARNGNELTNQIGALVRSSAGLMRIADLLGGEPPGDKDVDEV